MNREDLEMLEELINDALEAYLDSGYKLTDEYTINLRNLLKKLGLKEIWDYEKNMVVLMNKPKSITQLSKEQLEDLCLNLMHTDKVKTEMINQLEEKE